MVRKWKAAICALATIGTGGWDFAHGQVANEAPRPPSRVVAPISETKLVQLRGNINPAARPEFDRGAVDLQLPMERMLLILRRSPEQEASLEEFMARQLDPGLPISITGLSPRNSGPHMARPTATSKASPRENHGFYVDNVSNGRVFIEFSGTAGLVQQAFHTEIHHYLVKGQEHNRQQFRSEHSRSTQPGRRRHLLAAQFLFQTAAS